MGTTTYTKAQRDNFRVVVADQTTTPASTDELKLGNTTSVQWNTTAPPAITADVKAAVPTGQFLRDDGTWQTITIPPTPTGTGFRHITAGVEDAAAKLVDVGDINNNQVTYGKIQQLSARTVMGNSTNAVATGADISAASGGNGVLRESGGTLAFSTVNTANITANAVDNTKLAQMATSTVKGRVSAGTGNPEDLTQAQLQTLADQWTYAKLASDFTTSSATAVDITGLAFTPAASKNYEFEAILMLRSPTTATVNPEVGLAWPTGMTDGVASIEESQTATGGYLYAVGNINAALLIAAGGLPNTTQSWPCFVRGMLVAGGTPSGTLKLQLASETAATNVTVKAGSFLRWRTF